MSRMFVWATLWLFSLLMSCSVQADEVAYGAYGLYPVGSTRVLAMGGAFVGLSDDASAVVNNPAGLSMAKWRFDVAGASNRIVNKELDYSGDEQMEGLPYSTVFAGLALRLGRFGFGGGYSLNYDLQSDFGGISTVSKILKVESADASASLRLGKSFSIGATAHSEMVTLGYEDSVNNLQLEDTAEMVYPSFGILFSPSKRLGLGIRYSPERRYEMDTSLNSQIVSGSWFYDVVIPEKLSLGAMVASGNRLRWVGDLDFISPVKNALFVGGTEGDSNHQIKEQKQIVMHGGFEYLVIGKKDLDFIWRGGGYQEPARNDNTETRWHYTMGVEVRFGFVTFSAAYDQAKNFSNVAQSIGISLGAL